MTTTFTRRTMIAATATGAAVLAAKPALAAFDASPKPASRCASLHPLIGQNLAMYCDQPDVSVEQKNAALKSTHCPDCATRITPFGGAVGHVML